MCAHRVGLGELVLLLLLVVELALVRVRVAVCGAEHGGVVTAAAEVGEADLDVAVHAAVLALLVGG